MERVLDRPNVGEMISFLQTLPPDAPFRIEDPDTGWTISTPHLQVADGPVWVSGEYSEMDDSEKRLCDCATDGK